MTTLPAFPLSTYRLQFNSQFTFKNANDLVEYWHGLGISHCYSSPVMKAKSGSLHGYDITDPGEFNSEIGTREDFEAFVKDLRKYNMGLILDIVPNHMYIFDSSNKWWYDVLENGLSSPYAQYFDIDWTPPRGELANKVLLPLLDQQYGDALENQTLKIIYEEGIFSVKILDASLPTDPKSWSLILDPLVKKVEEILFPDDENLLEMKSIMTALTHLPSIMEHEKVVERYREKEIIKRRLGNLFDKNIFLKEQLFNFLIFFNGTKGDSRSFDNLEIFLSAQPYRLCFWRVANDEINYRRFFDISAYAGIRTEEVEVFEAVHRLLFELIQQKLIDGIRVDHVDGLWDPEQYLIDLQVNAILQSGNVFTEKDVKDKNSLFYVVAEKILTGNERLRQEWLLQGTVGYDFLNLVNGLYVEQSNKKAIIDIYQRFTSVHANISELIYACKKTILIVSMSSELYILTRMLDRISQQHRSSRDFTLESLRGALRDVIACFPVYRSYVRSFSGNIYEEDKQYLIAAITRAKRLNPAISHSIYDFIQNVLLLEYPLGLSEEQKKMRQDFIMHFQQLTGPVMAKGLEDTAFYRYFPLASLNEVGSSPHSFGTDLDIFHRKNRERSEMWPHTLLSTSTHDTKRSEDVRARINVLSEIPEEWEQSIERWSKLNEPHKACEGEEFIPDKNDEYLFYQTLVGSWPLYPMDISSHFQYIERMQGYMEKAIREAKVHSSWINPNKDYDKSMQEFIKNVLSLNGEEKTFLSDFKIFVSKIMKSGMFNSLSQILLKFASPGIPDIYQGNEIWDFSLVDPDNRRRIDFSSRINLLQEICEKTQELSSSFLEKLMHSPEDGRIKLFLTMQMLEIRKRAPNVFSKGNYLPIEVEGERSKHLIGFVRTFEKKTVIVIATRYFASLSQDNKFIVDPQIWNKTHVLLPKELRNNSYRNIFSGKILQKENLENSKINLVEVFHPLPLVLLESIEG